MLGKLFVHALALTADLVCSATLPVAYNPGTAALVIVTDGARGVTALSVTTNRALFAALAVAVGCTCGTTHSVVAGRGGVAALPAAERVAGFALALIVRIDFLPKRNRLQAKGSQHRASKGRTDHAQHFSP